MRNQRTARRRTFSVSVDVGLVAEVEHELLRVGQVAFDLLAEGKLQGSVPLLLELGDLDILLFETLRLLLDQAVFSYEFAILVRKVASTLREHRVARGQIVRECRFSRHARNIMTPQAKRKCFF
jgi:hypothetical protein